MFDSSPLSFDGLYAEPGSPSTPRAGSVLELSQAGMAPQAGHLESIIAGRRELPDPAETLNGMTLKSPNNSRGMDLAGAQSTGVVSMSRSRCRLGQQSHWSDANNKHSGNDLNQAVVEETAHPDQSPGHEYFPKQHFQIRESDHG
jgi:hypothetical protein